MSNLSESALLFEVAWEVCSQVGGIYTVLRSKAPAAVRRWEDNYFLIGPYREDSARVELEVQQPSGVIADVIKELSVGGIRFYYGRWLVTGRPQVLLADLASVGYRLPDIKAALWRDNGISSPDGDYEYDESCGFGFAVCEFLRLLQQYVGVRPVIAHFHEWQGAAALPMLRHQQVPVATVFTTHATLVGRALSAANANLYDHMAFINAGAVASEHGFHHRHALEGAAAQCSDVFSTVSGITALEGEQFLGRKPDALLPNGLNVDRFAAPHEFQVLHREAKDRIHAFIMGHFFPSYTFDLDRTLYVFTAGRYEYRNKGLDVFIDALVELNRRMREEGSSATVVAFIVTRAPVRAINVQTLARQAMFNEVRETCEQISEEMGRKLLQMVAVGCPPTLDDLLDEYAAVRLKRLMYALRASAPPAIITHDLWDDAHDPVLNHLRARGLWNMAHDRVKVIFHPEFMQATSPLLGMDYDQFVRGCHVGVFPSYYEPWGYTPMECIVRGLPAITSDLSGFGSYVQEHFPHHDEVGMYVAHRRHASFETSVNEIAGWLHNLTRMSRRDRIGLRNRVESNAEHFDWNNMGRYYVAAYRMACERRYGDHGAVPVDPVAEPEWAEPPAPKSPRKTRTTRRRKRGSDG